MAKDPIAIHLASVAQLCKEMTQALNVLTVTGSESEEGKAAIRVLDECVTEIASKQRLEGFSHALVFHGGIRVLEEALKVLWHLVMS